MESYVIGNTRVRKNIKTENRENNLIIRVIQEVCICLSLLNGLNTKDGLTQRKRRWCTIKGKNGHHRGVNDICSA